MNHRYKKKGKYERKQMQWTNVMKLRLVDGVNETKSTIEPGFEFNKQWIIMNINDQKIFIAKCSEGSSTRCLQKNGDPPRCLQRVEVVGSKSLWRRKANTVRFALQQQTLFVSGLFVLLRCRSICQTILTNPWHQYCT